MPDILPGQCEPNPLVETWLRPFSSGCYSITRMLAEVIDNALHYGVL